MSRLIVFDCDGTLVDSQANIIRAMQDTFDRHRLDPPDDHRVRRVVGLSLVEAMQALMPEADGALHLSLADDYKQAFQRLRSLDGLAEEPLFPGVGALVAELAADGYSLGVATGKSDRGLALCLAHHGLNAHFVTLQTADRHPSKPHPAMLLAAMTDAGFDAADTMMIGDTLFDIHMATAAGATGIGVGWGYHGPDELAAAGARLVVSDAPALRAAIDHWTAERAAA